MCEVVHFIIQGEDTVVFVQKKRNISSKRVLKCLLCYLYFLTFSFGELHFAPGDSELEIAVNIIDDDIPEVQEQFLVRLKNPKGGAEIGFGGQLKVIVPTNDDAYGVIGFAQVGG